MIKAGRLLDDLKRLLKRLEDDLRQRATSVEAMQTALQREYAAAKEAGRAGEAFEVWREGMLTQAGAAWLLSGVFVRFLEDNGLVDEALLSGPGERRDEASERQMQFSQASHRQRSGLLQRRLPGSADAASGRWIVRRIA